jgi:hypothetical protein
MVQKLIAELIVGVDIGASLTKCIYSYSIGGGEAKVGIKTACSMVRSLTKSIYVSELNSVDNNTSVVMFEGGYWLVGNSSEGKTVSINATESKSQTAIAKSLAIVGQLLNELGQQGVTEVRLMFGILLPLDEWGDRVALEKRLEQALWEFEFNGVTVRTALIKGIHVSPEGYGISRLIVSEIGGVFIFGHRDVSWLHVEKGSILRGKSKTFAGYGMHRLINQIGRKFNKDELLTAAILFAAGHSLKDKYFEDVVDKSDLPQLKEAIRDAREQVWLDLTTEFRSTTCRFVEQIPCSGGNSYYWQPELKQYLGQRFDPCMALRQEMEARFPKLRGSPFLFRGADVYAFTRTLPGFPQLVAERYAHV